MFSVRSGKSARGMLRTGTKAASESGEVCGSHKRIVGIPAQQAEHQTRMKPQYQTFLALNRRDFTEENDTTVRLAAK